MVEGTVSLFGVSGKGSEAFKIKDLTYTHKKGPHGEGKNEYTFDTITVTLPKGPTGLYRTLQDGAAVYDPHDTDDHKDFFSVDYDLGIATLKDKDDDISTQLLGFNLIFSSSHPVPAPSTIPLLGLGIVALSVIRTGKKRITRTSAKTETLSRKAKYAHSE